MPIFPHIDPEAFAHYPLWARAFILACMFGYAIAMLGAAIGFSRRSE